MDKSEERPTCPKHGDTLKRRTCRSCRAAYMRLYMRGARRRRPERTIWEQARKRATHRGVRFVLRRQAVVIPPFCPALGIPIITGAKRSPNSPSLDRISPAVGYVDGNVRVLSDHANRLKGNLDLDGLLNRANRSEPARREEYLRLADYVRREMLLADVRRKAAQGGRAGEEWAKIARFLDRAFVRADWCR